ncbi:MAG: hypothetical protein ACI4MM_08800 [Candidatus Ventricola sp.]
MFEARARSDSVVQTSIRLNMSDRTVKRLSASIARKIARAGHGRRIREGCAQDQAE